jgi:hypothetical protein
MVPPRGRPAQGKALHGAGCQRGQFASQSSNKLTISTINRLNLPRGGASLREAEQLHVAFLRLGNSIYHSITFTFETNLNFLGEWLELLSRYYCIKWLRINQSSSS